MAALQLANIILPFAWFGNVSKAEALAEAEDGLTGNRDLDASRPGALYTGIFERDFTGNADNDLTGNAADPIDDDDLTGKGDDALTGKADDSLTGKEGDALTGKPVGQSLTGKAQVATLQ